MATTTYRCVVPCRAKIRYEDNTTERLILPVGVILQVEVNESTRIMGRLLADKTAKCFVMRKSFDNCFEGKSNLQAALAANAKEQA